MKHSRGKTGAVASRAPLWSTLPTQVTSPLCPLWGRSRSQGNGASNTLLAMQVHMHTAVADGSLFRCCSSAKVATPLPSFRPWVKVPVTGVVGSWPSFPVFGHSLLDGGDTVVYPGRLHGGEGHVRQSVFFTFLSLDFFFKSWRVTLFLEEELFIV